ncbi:single-stranded DNA-binding protein [Erwinia phage Snitter]|nr:single-stranded DNA-binding protein [Erwinia phage Snitter]
MHVISGEIRKEVYTKDGSGQKGPYTLFIVELSEKHKDREGQTQYTNYRAAFFANERQLPYYRDWLAKGKFVTISAETLGIEQRESNGNNYITLNCINPRLMAFQSSNQGGNQGGGNQGWGQPQQPNQKPQQNQHRQSQPQSNEPPMDFDDDIPF